MIKKSLKLMTVILGISIMLAGCSSKNNDSAQSSSDNSKKTETSSKSSESTSKDSKNSSSTDTTKQTDAGATTSSNDLSKAIKGTIDKPTPLNSLGVIHLYQEDNLDTPVNCGMSVDKITRGEEAKKLVDKFNNSDTGMVFGKLNDGFEFVVIDATVTVPKDSKQCTADNYAVHGTDGNAVEYNNMALVGIPVLQIDDARNEFLKPGESKKIQIATMLPIETKAFLLEATGIKDEDKTYFIVK